MPRRLTVLTFVAMFSGAVFLSWQTMPTPAQQSVDTSAKQVKQPTPPLPIGQVILFSSGVGYFQREGEVEGSTRVDLSFPSADVNDLLKSLVLQDMSGGHISTITYDSPDPIEKTLKSFALDLTYNPTFGQILNQTRGERIEVTYLATNATPQASLSGVIVGMESRKTDPGGQEVDLLNLLCADGMRNVNLVHVLRVRFLNPLLDGEFKRALEVLASTHDSQKKLVSLDFSGAGKRRVRVGYVVENPIWKTSYRLVLSEKDKPFLQGWAIVENTSDEDWKDVRMALVSGRPISFQLGLYEPLYVPRPWVEPELFASLRPPVYSGALTNAGQVGMGGAGIGGLAGLGGGQQVGSGGGLGFGGGGQVNLGGGGGQLGLGGGMNRYQGMNFGNLGGQFGLQGWGPALHARPQGASGFNPAGGGGQGADEDIDLPSAMPGKISYEQLQKRLQEKRAAKEQAKSAGSVLAAIDPKQGVDALATAEEIGDRFEYLIDQKVNLPRQKSALLPIVHGEVEATKVSIFNEATHAKFPVLGLKFKNTSGHPLVQGPVTIYEGGNYAGDARILDLQPNEERLIGYALDLGIEIKPEAKDIPEQLVSVKIVKGVVQATHKLRQTKAYLIKNRAAHDRALLIEHPVRPDWKLVAPEKPAEISRDVYRFQANVPAGKTARQLVIEEQTQLERYTVLAAEEQRIRLLLAGTIASVKVKAALQKTLNLRTKLDATLRAAAMRDGELRAIADDQARIRANLEKMPQTSAAYTRYLKKFDTQESEIESLQAEIKQLRASAKNDKKEYEDFVAGLTVD